MFDKIEIVSVNVSEEKGVVKKPVSEIKLDDRGIAGDAHAGDWHRQVSLLGQDSVDRFAEEAGRPIAPGEFAENLTVSGIDLMTVGVLDRFISGDCELEVTQLGKSCHGTTCAIFREVGKCVMPKEGIFCRVIKGGTLKAADPVKYVPYNMGIRVITLSDRAHAGEYQDLSGPRIVELLNEYFEGKRWHPQIETVLLPDDPEGLTTELNRARTDGVDTVIVTGGTGVGPRDFTPETVSVFCDKMVPGVMDAIRLKFGADKPNALLSRSVLGASGTMLVYALPGSVRAVSEYMGEIMKTWEHLIFMMGGLGHG
jgi:molybdopterin adenylyltransferase